MKLKQLDLTLDKWNRNKTGWIALCDKHLNLYLDKKKDGYTDISDEDHSLYCDHKDCNKEAKYELYPNLLEELKNVDLDNCVPLEDLDI